MRRARLPQLPALLGLALLLSACGSAADPPADPGPATTAPTASATLATPDPTSTSLEVSTPAPGKTTPITVVGTLEEGVERGCWVITDESSGELYSVTDRDVPELGSGTRVKVTGHLDPELMSFCQQGQILVVDEVTDPDA